MPGLKTRDGAQASPRCVCRGKILPSIPPASKLGFQVRDSIHMIQSSNHSLAKGSVHLLHARSEQGLLFSRCFLGWCHCKNCKGIWLENARQEFDICSPKKFRLAAPQNNLNPERNVSRGLLCIFLMDPGVPQPLLVYKTVGFSEPGELVSTWFQFSVILILVKTGILMLSQKGSQINIFHVLGKYSHCAFVKEGWHTMTPTTNDLHSYIVWGL